MPLLVLAQPARRWRLPLPVCGERVRVRGILVMRGPEKRRTSRSRLLRQQDNDAEAAIWTELRNRRLGGYKFVRQHPIDRYFADFACRELKLVVEIDGSQHAQSERDSVRDAGMLDAGWSVLRIWAHDCLKDQESVLETILAACDGRLAPCDTHELRYFHATNRGGVN